jgi:hypothetical protein
VFEIADPASGEASSTSRWIRRMLGNMTSRTGWVENGGKVGVGLVMGHFSIFHTQFLYL